MAAPSSRVGVTDLTPGCTGGTPIKTAPSLHLPHTEHQAGPLPHPMVDKELHIFNFFAYKVLPGAPCWPAEESSLSSSSGKAAFAALCLITHPTPSLFSLTGAPCEQHCPQTVPMKVCPSTHKALPVLRGCLPTSNRQRQTSAVKGMPAITKV